MVVFGQLARDLVLCAPEIPDAGSSVDVRERVEELGGKGANQAVALAQLGARPSLVAVAGDDDVGDALLARAASDGIDVSGVVRRPGPTGLIVEVLLPSGDYRYFEHLGERVQLHTSDVTSSASIVEGAAAALVQLQQPAPAVVSAARLGRTARALVVLDGAPPDGTRDDLLLLADVLRADAREAPQWTDVSSVDGAALREATEALLRRGPRVVALALDGGGNLFSWRDEETVHHLVVPDGPERVRDTTGGGDSLVAALTVGLLAGYPVPDAARCAVAASGRTVTRVGGRPDLTGLFPR
ncbi:ribokinase [Virgisporangium aliadipatigenens]|uniref:Ribokinase n=1 Tax=Virgisporangium aliadipatigenens TaxID=741659 RepID=A0A8J3YID9_9ACTN|nr:ribokinase [Virgisporangium aliadipatigenens]